MTFKPQDVLPFDVYSKVTNWRIEYSGSREDAIRKLAHSRNKRSELTCDGRLTILAADHPARMILEVGDDSLAMGNRYEFLARVISILSLPDWDGVMATADVLEELLIIDRLFQETEKSSFLDKKVLIGSMNRGGLKNAVFELDDCFTSFTAKRLSELKLDGGKMMFRLDLNNRDSLETLRACVKAINELNELGMTIFLEPLPAGKKLRKEADDIVKLVSVATALGNSSARMWLKIPYVDNFEQAAQATTCPILMLGGATKNTQDFLDEIRSGMESGHNVRGILAGRNVLYPFSGDPQAIAKEINNIVHKESGEKVT